MNSSIEESFSKLTKMIANTFQVMQEYLKESQYDFLSLINGLFQVVGWTKALEILLDHQIMMTDSIPKELEDKILLSEDVPKLMEEYYTENNQSRLNVVTQRCQEAPQMEKHQVLFSQVLAAYHIGLYQIACMGLFAIADELLSSLSGIYKPKDEKRMKEIAEKININTPLAEFDYDLWSAYFALSKEDNTFYDFHGFDGEEPTTLNRHWTMHGRSTRDYQKIDFIRVLLWIDALTRLDEFKGE